MSKRYNYLSGRTNNCRVFWKGRLKPSFLLFGCVVWRDGWRTGCTVVLLRRQAALTWRCIPSNVGYFFPFAYTRGGLVVMDMEYLTSACSVPRPRDGVSEFILLSRRQACIERFPVACSGELSIPDERPAYAGPRS